MAHPSKRKGNGYERELVKGAQDVGFAAERAYASNGKALGESEDTDLVLEDGHGLRVRIQAKRRKALPAYLQPTPGVDAVVFREDRGASLVLVTWDAYLRLLASSQP